MAWTVEVTDEFEAWWDGLSEEERVSIDGMIRVLETHGPTLGAPYSPDEAGSRPLTMRQLLVPHQGRQICVLYLSDTAPLTVVLLSGTTAGSVDEPCPPEHLDEGATIFQKYLRRRFAQ